MQKTYAIAVERPFQLEVLPLGPFTLAQAEHWREVMAQAGKPVMVINLNAA